MIAVSLLFRGRLCEGRFLFISIRLSDTPVTPVSSNASVITAESLTYRVKHLEGTSVIFCRTEKTECHGLLLVEYVGTAAV